MSDSRFATTHWSLVLEAGRRGTPAADVASDDALAVLCQTYWTALYAFVRRSGHAVDEAQDLTQEFFVRLLERNYLGDADPERGRFRSFLLASMKHFLANQWKRERAQKRGGGRRHVSLDFLLAEDTYLRELAGPLSAEQLYERRWAMTLLEQSLAQLRGEHDRAGKAEQFAQLKPYLTADGAAQPYAAVAASLGMSEVAVKMAVHRLRGRYRELIRQAVAQTVETPEDAEDELRSLAAIFAG